MAPVLQEVLAANEAYAASFGDKGKLAMPPARRFAILTCMDARLDPAKYAGLAEGDAHIDGEPFAGLALAKSIKCEVHADLANPAKRREHEFVGGAHHLRVPINSPCRETTTCP